MFVVLCSLLDSFAICKNVCNFAPVTQYSAAECFFIKQLKQLRDVEDRSANSDIKFIWEQLTQHFYSQGNP